MDITAELDSLFDAAGYSANGTGECVLTFPPSFSAFRGHFPDHPILAGIVQLTVIRRMAERHSGCALRLNELRRVKYLRLILPDMPVKISLTTSEPDENGSIIVEALIENEQGEKMTSASVSYTKNQLA